MIWLLVVVLIIMGYATFPFFVNFFAKKSGKRFRDSRFASYIADDESGEVMALHQYTRNSGCGNL